VDQGIKFFIAVTNKKSYLENFPLFKFSRIEMDVLSWLSERMARRLDQNTDIHLVVIRFKAQIYNWEKALILLNADEVNPLL
jgi:hypothetical protein